MPRGRRRGCAGWRGDGPREEAGEGASGSVRGGGHRAKNPRDDGADAVGELVSEGWLGAGRGRRGVAAIESARARVGGVVGAGRVARTSRGQEEGEARGPPRRGRTPRAGALGLVRPRFRGCGRARRRGTRRAAIRARLGPDAVVQIRAKHERRARRATVRARSPNRREGRRTPRAPEPRRPGRAARRGRRHRAHRICPTHRQCRRGRRTRFFSIARASSSSSASISAMTVGQRWACRHERRRSFRHHALALARAAMQMLGAFREPPRASVGAGDAPIDAGFWAYDAFARASPPRTTRPAETHHHLPAIPTSRPPAPPPVRVRRFDDHPRRGPREPRERPMEGPELRGRDGDDVPGGGAAPLRARRPTRGRPRPAPRPARPRSPRGIPRRAFVRICSGRRSSPRASPRVRPAPVDDVDWSALRAVVPSEAASDVDADDARVSVVDVNSGGAVFFCVFAPDSAPARHPARHPPASASWW